MTSESVDEEPSAKMLKCSHCPKEFKYNSERNRHELSHSPRFECEVCCKKFSFVSALRRHQKQHERTGSVKCKECNRKFRDEVLLKRHMKYAHKGTFTCTKCSTPFSSDQALRTHMKTHKPESERRFKCSFDGCEKSFNFSHHLKHHELTHTNAKQHYCSVCGKGFIQSHHLKTHLKTHDPSEWLYCEVAGCKKKFSTEYARKRHMTTHKIKPDSGISSDSCSCDASISSKEGDSVLCSSCGENVLPSEFSKHSTKCGDILEISSNIQSWTISPLKQENAFDHDVPTPKRIFDSYLGGCKSALGGCLLSVENCVCAHMSKPSDDNYDFNPIGNVEYSDMTENNINIDFSENHCEKIIETFDFNGNKAVLKRTDLVDKSITANRNLDSYNLIENTNMCGNCDCASSCNSRNPSNSNDRTDEDFVTTVEYRNDGVVTIKDTCDLDIPIKTEDNRREQFQQFIPFSTCRDVIGNCIVGGNEGCLCAKMMMDEQQAMAQEIDDITPKPKTENYIML